MKRDNLHENPATQLGGELRGVRGLAEAAHTRPAGMQVVRPGHDVLVQDTTSTKSLRQMGRTQDELDAAMVKAKADLAEAERRLAQARLDIDASAARIVAAQSAADQARSDAQAASGVASQNTQKIQDQWNATVAADNAVRDAAAADAKAKADQARAAAIEAAVAGGNLLSGGATGSPAGATTATEAASGRTIVWPVYESLRAHVGKQITVSYDIMCDVAGSEVLPAYPYQNSGVSVADNAARYVVPTAWERRSHTTTVKEWSSVPNPSGFTSGAVAWHLPAAALPAGKSLRVRNLKIELGPVATPHSPSIVDVLVIAAEDATVKAGQAETNAKAAAATDAKSKADAAQAAAVSAATAAAAQDAAAKDAAIKAQALAEAAVTAQQKADAAAAQAKAQALAAAATDAQQKADAAKAAAIAAADAKFADQATALTAAQNRANAAMTAAQTAQATADGAIRTHYVPTAPWPDGTTGRDADVGDLWYRTGDGAALRWNGATWEIIPDAAVAAALKAAQDAQSTADQKITSFYQPGKPSDADVGDLWFNTADKNRAYRCTVASTTNPTFVLIADGRIADAQQTADDAKTAAAAASAKATSEANAAKAAAIAAAAADADAKDAAAKAATLTAAATTAEQKAAAAAATAEANAKTAAALDAKAKADAAQAAAVQAARDADALLKATLDSRGTDLVTNGTGSLGDNTNFSTFTINKTDVPTGAAASFYGPAVQTSRFTDEALPFDPSKRYRFSFQARQTVAGSTDRAYGMLAPLDQWGNAIEPQRYKFHAGTTTTLTADIKPGDTTVKLASVAGWWGAAGKPAGVSTEDRSMILWGWTDPNGKVWPEHTYSRRHWAIDQWADGGVNPTTNTITLKAPWPASAGTVTAGTKVSNGSSGGSYIYMPSLRSGVPSEAWTTYADTYSAGVMGEATAATGRPTATWTTGMPPGIAKVRIGWLLNYPPSPANSVAGRHAIAAVSFSDASAAQATADQAVTDAAAASAKATTEAAKAEAAAKAAAALDATAKAAQAEAAAKTAAAADAKSKADAAQAAAVAASGTDATTKANAARAAAEAAAAADATAKAAAAESAAKTAAAADATTKANAAKAVAEAAQRAADAAKTAADQAKAAADAAQQTASNALTSANGRNAIIVSTANATGTVNPKTGLPLVAGDNWIKEELPSHFAVARWVWSGTEWIPMPISGEMVTNFDVHKLTVSGSARMTQVVADKIIADAAYYGALTVDRLTAGTADMNAAVIQKIDAALLTVRKIYAKEIIGDGATFQTGFIRDLCAQVVTSGLFRTAASGQRWEMDVAGLRFYGPDGTEVVHIDGVNNAFKGEFSGGSQTPGENGFRLGKHLPPESTADSYYGLQFTAGVTEGPYPPGIFMKRVYSPRGVTDPVMVYRSGGKEVPFHDVVANGETPATAQPLTLGTLDGITTPGDWVVEHAATPSGTPGRCWVRKAGGSAIVQRFQANSVNQEGIWERRTLTSTPGTWSPWVRYMPAGTENRNAQIAWGSGGLGETSLLVKDGGLVTLQVSGVRNALDPICTLPVGCRPTMNVAFSGINEATNAPIKVWIGPDGKVHIPPATNVQCSFVATFYAGL